jgi:hypothetical protein
MKLLSSLLSIPSSTEPDSFDWGVAEFSSILHHGVTYDKVEVDFLDGEVRFYQHFDPKRLLQSQAPTIRRRLTASIQHSASARPVALDDPEPDIAPAEAYTPSELRGLDVPVINNDNE